MKYDDRGNLEPMSDREAIRAAKRWSFFGILAIIAVSLIGWQVGWWFKAENVDRQVDIDNNNKGTQTAWRDEAKNAVSDFYLVDPTNSAAQGALRNKACDLIGRLNDNYRDDNLVTFEAQECN